MLEILRLQNPWWNTGKVPEKYLGEFDRKLFNSLKKDLKNNKITSVIGPRRSGKTTILHELITALIKEKTGPERIFYLQFDVSDLAKSGVLNELMEYISNSLGEPIEALKKRIYIFLDEVHRLENWSNEIKQWQDLKLKIKFIVSGSSAMNILKGSGESLLGRINHFTLLPMNFNELLSNKYKIQTGTQRTGYEYYKLRKIYARLLPNMSKIKIAFNEYISKGGYPEIIKEDIEKSFRLLIDYKDLSLQRDLFDTEEIRDVKSVKELVRVLASLIGERVNYSKIASILGIKMDTVKKYISLLEDIYLVKEAKVFSKKPFFSIRKERKIFFIDLGMVNAVNLKYKLMENEYFSKLVENIVARKLLERSLKRELSPELFYWVDKYGKEIDFIFEGKEIIPVEVKYREQIATKEYNTLLKFMDIYKLNTGLIITKNTLKREKIKNKKIISIPAWLFLLVEE